MIFHLNCGSFSPWFPRLKGIVYCLLVETSAGPVLVDTGFGEADFTGPSRMMRLFTFLLRARRNRRETAASQVQQLGYSVQDVRHIVFTHLHLDHAGGLRDFPEAQVHVFKREHEVAMRPRGFLEQAYDASHWAHNPRWVLHEQTDREWYGFNCLRILKDVEPEILLIPLPGHTSGHCGVAIRDGEGWLFHCGDAASPFHREADPHEASRRPLDFLPRWLVRQVIGRHVPRFRELIRSHGHEIELISSHDASSFERMAGRAA